jgi:hypothetical protein
VQLSKSLQFDHIPLMARRIIEISQFFAFAKN